MTREQWEARTKDDMVVKKGRLRQTINAYMNTRFILPTSNVSDRRFSMVGYAFGDRRKGTLPANFEMPFFLRANSDLWGVSDVQYISKTKHCFGKISVAAQISWIKCLELIFKKIYIYFRVGKLKKLFKDK